MNTLTIAIVELIFRKKNEKNLQVVQKINMRYHMKLIKATEFFTDKSYLLRNFFSSPIYDELCSPFVFGYQEILDGYDNEIIGGDFYMLNYTISGNAKMYFNEREYTLQKGDLTIVHTFSSRRLVKCGDEPWVIHFAHYASFVASSLFKYINQLGEIIIHDFPSELIVPYLSKTYQLLKMSLDEETQHKVSLINYEMLLRIIHYLDSQKKKEKSQDVVDDLIIYMKEHFTDIKSIKKLIETYPYSQTHLERLFRKK